jgi:hypothetical protein
MGDMADFLIAEREAEDLYSGYRLMPRSLKRRLSSNARRKHGVVDYGGGLYLPMIGGQVALNPASAPSPSPRDELRAAEELKQSLDARIKVLRERVRKAPSEPITTPRISVKVQYTPRGKMYEFLMLKVPDGRWFSTSTQPEAQVFSNWDAVVDWLLSEDIHTFSVEALDSFQVPF